MTHPRDLWTPRGLWTLNRAVAGFDLNGEADSLTEPLRSMVAMLAAVRVDDALTGQARQEAQAAARAPLSAAIAAARPDLAAALVNGPDPSGPPPEADAGARFATVADVRRLQSETRWVWEGWIPTGRVFGLAAYEGTGKTRTAMDLHRRVWHGAAWPDNQGPTLPPGRPAVWVCADGHQDELTELLPAFGLPDGSVVFPTTPDDPYGGTDIDSPDLMAPGGLLDGVIASVDPWCVFIDTLTSATSNDLCDQRVIKGLKTPLVRLAQSFGVNVCLMLHLSREGQALGRRTKGITRTLMHLECPDPENSPGRLRFWVEKTYAKKPPALGVTMTDGGNKYDFEPPPAPKPGKPGRPPEARDKAERFIRDALAVQNDRVGNETAAEYVKAKGSKTTFWRAVDAMVEAGELATDGGPGTGKQAVLHLIDLKSDPDTDRPF
jgi:hypothetical protein